MKSSISFFEDNFIFILIPILILCICWFYLLFKKKYLWTLISVISISPFLHKLSNYLEIAIYQNQSILSGGFIQKFYITFIPFLLIYIRLMFDSRFSRQSNSSKFFNYYLFFGLGILTTLMINHNFFTATSFFWLIFLQYFIFFYILSKVVTRLKDLDMILLSFLTFFLFNVISRVFLDGQPLAPIISGENFRVGANSLGPAVSYALYLVILITFSILLFSKNKYLMFSLIILLMSELINTFTRGGLVILVFLVLIFFFDDRLKRQNYLYILAILCLGFIAYPYIIQVFAIRSDSSSLRSEGSILIRIELVNNLLSNYKLNIWGNGVGNPTYIIYNNIAFPVHNAFLEILDQCGIIVFLFFLNIVLYSTKLLFSINTNKPEILRYRNYFIIALFQWIIYANTTSTSILYYYPYEGTLIFWFIIFSPMLLKQIDRNKNSE